MPKLFSFRKPRLRVTKKGKVGLSGGGMRIGGKGGGINLSRKGVSGSVRTPLGSYNTRRGLSTGGRRGNCMRVVVFLVMCTGAIIATVAYGVG